MEVNMLYNESNLETMKRMPDNSIDSVVTDPPYELGFMGKAWDKSGITYSVELWKEVLRVLKPGGYLLSFGGSRTYHRMACAIEDAGFEIRDMIEWVYGSGFPKSLDISKAIDKQGGAERGRITLTNRSRKSDGGSSWRDMEGRSDNIDNIPDYNPILTEAKQWSGWGTALKPAHEPICMARKPLSENTVAENVLRWGTGGINVDGGRVGYQGDVDPRTFNGWNAGQDSLGHENNLYKGGYKEGYVPQSSNLGRFPANLVHDGSDEVVAIFPDSTSVAMTKSYEYQNNGFSMGAPTGSTKHLCEASKGSAARFFYCAKASWSERNMGCEGMGEKPIPYSEYRENVETTKSVVSNYPDGSPRPMNKPNNHHPTVKPIALMKYLVKLVTPPGGIIYDPFTGSGSTLIAAKQLGFNYIGSELQAEYVEIANARILSANNPPLTLF